MEQAQNPARKETPSGKNTDPLSVSCRMKGYPADDGETNWFESETIGSLPNSHRLGDGNLLIRTLSVLIFWARMRTESRRPSINLVKAPAKSKTERRIRDTDKTGPGRSQRSL